MLKWLEPATGAKASNYHLHGQKDVTHNKPPESVSGQPMRFNEHMMNQVSVVMEAAGLEMCG